ncbi:MAG: hypothetical protein ISQ00_05180 [Luminiphilus sp.]|jgi:hypothetical protein|nr:hypothetical protein [Luminiphilus sp.]MBL6821223.1 hypothetical protein [Luminiphilus sp.]
MMNLLRALTALSGLGLLLIGLGWWIHPAAAAEMLGASLLEGTGRSTQIGDSGAFFIGAGALLAWGAIRKSATLTLVGGILVALVIPGRVLSATTHGGAWTPDEIAGECIILILSLATAWVLRRQAEPSLFR